MKRTSYTNVRRDTGTAKGTEPPMGETVTLMAITIDHRPGFKLSAANGWFSLHRTRRDALAWVIQNGWRTRASAITEGRAT